MTRTEGLAALLLSAVITAGCSSGSPSSSHAAATPTGPTAASFRTEVGAAGAALSGWNVAADYTTHATDIDNFAAAVETAEAPSDERAQQLALIQQAHVLAEGWRSVAGLSTGLFTGIDEQGDAIQSKHLVQQEQALRDVIRALPS